MRHPVPSPSREQGIHTHFFPSKDHNDAESCSPQNGDGEAIIAEKNRRACEVKPSLRKQSLPAICSHHSQEQQQENRGARNLGNNRDERMVLSHCLFSWAVVLTGSTCLIRKGSQTTDSCFVLVILAVVCSLPSSAFHSMSLRGDMMTTQVLLPVF